MNTILYIMIQLAVMILLAPLVNGVIARIKAVSQKRRGVPLLQMYYDIYKLMHKGVVVSEVSSWIFKATPYIVLSSTLAAAVLVPVTTRTGSAGFSGDLILVVYLLALGRFFMCLAGLDTGSTFGAMGSSREAMISALIEPTILVSAFTVGLSAGSTSVIEMMAAMQQKNMPLTQPAFVLTFAAMMLVIIAETSRIPVDDPSTHLELTMVHEAMILEYSGRHLAMMELGAAVKQLVLMVLVVNLFLPHEQMIQAAGAASLVLSLAIFTVKILAAAIVIGLMEVFTVKLRFFSISNFAAVSFILAFLGFMQYFVLGR